MKNILLLGAGKIGAIITELLSTSNDYQIVVADIDADNLARLPKHKNVQTCRIDVSDKQALLKAMQNKFAVLSAMPFQITRQIALAASEANIHYLDLTEDVATTQYVKQLAESSSSAFIPQCGLAPGFITIAAYELAKKFDTLQNLHLRAGALPTYPSNQLKYNLTRSTDGLINEYCNPCEAIVEGQLVQVPPLEELDNFSLDGVDYEAFNTSGGLGTLCDTLAGKVSNLNYRTVRYPGHRDIMKMLLQDLRLKDKRPLLKQIMEEALPITYQDVVLVFVNASGHKDGLLVQESYVNKIYARTINGKLWSAIQITTAAGICAVLDLLATGKLAQQGLIKQEDINFEDFINNRFGNYFGVAA